MSLIILPVDLDDVGEVLVCNKDFLVGDEFSFRDSLVLTSSHEFIHVRIGEELSVVEGEDF